MESTKIKPKLSFFDYFYYIFDGDNLDDKKRKVITKLFNTKVDRSNLLPENDVSYALGYSFYNDYKLYCKENGYYYDEREEEVSELEFLYAIAFTFVDCYYPKLYFKSARIKNEGRIADIFWVVMDFVKNYDIYGENGLKTNEFHINCSDLAKFINNFYGSKKGIRFNIYDHLGRKFPSTKKMCDYYKIPQSTFLGRKRKGWSTRKALTTPFNPRMNRKKDEECAK